MDALNQLSDYGTPVMDSKRVIFMSINVFFQCLSLILFIVGMAAWSTDADTISNTYWTYTEDATSNEFVTFYGLRAYVDANLNNDDTGDPHTWEHCEDENDYCDYCRTAGQTALAMMLLAFFSLCPLVMTTGLRVMKALDNKWMKFAGIFFTSSVLFWSIVAVWNWQGSCVANGPIPTGTTGYKNGPGYNCVVCNIFWMLLSLYIHLCTSSTIVGETSEPLTDQDETEGGSQSQGQEQDQNSYVTFGDEK